MLNDFEKLGEFYLGRVKDADNGALLYNSTHLTTHAMIVGMTGSGKTGLALTMIEEAAIDGVPALLIDPKGDLANILLQFPNLAPEDFRPWINADDAVRSGVTIDELAEKTAHLWRDGLASWGEDGERIRRLAASADFAVYTPGDISGRPLQILREFNAPSDADDMTLRDSILNSVSSLLSLIGIDADPVQSREHILLSAVFSNFWKQQCSFSLEQLIGAVATPQFAKIGVFDLETFYPSQDRMKLALALNSLLASPGFAAWREGEPLDIGKLLHTADGRPRVSVLSIAHLSDAERMFFVTAVLNATTTWMRRQTGTGSLRAILYMDEIFGYFPPSANPPSKTPMLTLLKQARAFGVGVVLSTQNPVDLDYKGLSNCGTWFIGRLQTDRDKQRILDGLEGVAAGSMFDRTTLDRQLSGLGKRVFLMRDINDDKPVVFESRWVLSFMCGPMSSAQVKSFIEKTPQSEQSDKLPPTKVDEKTEKQPAIAAKVRLHFVNAKIAADVWQTRYYRSEPDASDSPIWDSAEELDAEPVKITGTTIDFGKKIDSWSKQLASHIYQSGALTLWRDPFAKISSEVGESEGNFRIRAAQIHREQRDAAVEKIKASYQMKLQRLKDRIQKAETKVEHEKAQVRQRTMSTAVWLGSTILGALLGRGRSITGMVGRAGTTARSAMSIDKEKRDVNTAEESVEMLRNNLTALESEFSTALEDVQTDINPQTIKLEEIVIRPRKSDIIVENIFRTKE